MQLNCTAYSQASCKEEKTKISRSIVASLRNTTPPGRFLQKSEDDSNDEQKDATEEVFERGNNAPAEKDVNSWEEIGDKKAWQKTSQLLRELVSKGNHKTVYQKRKWDMQKRKSNRKSKQRRKSDNQNDNNKNDRTNCENFEDSKCDNCKLTSVDTKPQSLPSLALNHRRGSLAPLSSITRRYESETSSSALVLSQDVSPHHSTTNYLDLNRGIHGRLKTTPVLNPRNNHYHHQPNGFQSSFQQPNFVHHPRATTTNGLINSFMSPSAGINTPMPLQNNHMNWRNGFAHTTPMQVQIPPPFINSGGASMNNSFESSALLNEILHLNNALRTSVSQNIPFSTHQQSQSSHHDANCNFMQGNSNRSRGSL